MPTGGSHCLATNCTCLKLPAHEEVETPPHPKSGDQEILDVRVWWKNQMLQSTTLPMQGITVHF